MEKVHEEIKEKAKIKFKIYDKVQAALPFVIWGKKNVSVVYIWTNRQSYDLAYFKKLTQMDKCRIDINLWVQESVTSYGDVYKCHLTEFVQQPQLSILQVYLLLA